jgi:outer membrane protein assembly factor BamB
MRILVTQFHRGATLTACLCILASATSLVFAGDNWPEFRGPTGDGHSDATGLPLHWSETENIRWKTAIHDKGWSSPVIWGKKVWMTTATADGKKLFVICVDRDTGKILHDIELFDVAKPAFCHPFNSYASSTPAVEDNRVYVHFGSAGTACLDSEAGKTIWSRRDLPCDHYRGAGSSPVLYHDLLILSFDGADFQYLVALDKKSGNTVWKRDRDIDYGTTVGDMKKAFSTPAIVKLPSGNQLVSPAAVATIAYDPATGSELWRVRHGGMNAAARPLFGLGMVYVCTGDSGPVPLFAVKPDGHGDITKSQVAWKQNRGVPARASILLIGDTIFMASEKGVASCLDARTGQPVWQKRLGGEFIASPVFADDKIYCFNTDGQAHVLKPGREEKVLAINRLADGCMASPAIAGKSLFVRTKTHLYRIEEGATASIQP